MKLIFLDIDGVLNGHDWDPKAVSNRIRPECVQRLNRIVRATEARIVLSSAWRYMVHMKALTLLGFEYLLRTHGGAGLRIIGLTEPDEICPACGKKHRRKEVKYDLDGYQRCIDCGTSATRGCQISAYLRDHPKPEAYVAIDDCDLDITAHGHPLVLTSPRSGLSERKAREAVRILNQ